MKRIEIIANHSVEQNVMDLLKKAGIAGYTKIPVVHGAGDSNPKMGTSVWPEENFMLVIYSDENRASALREQVERLKLEFPDEGIKYFEMG